MAQVAVSPSYKLAVLAIPATILTIFPGYVDPINLPKVLVLLALSLAAVILHLSLRSFSSKKVFSSRAKIVLAIYLSLAVTMLVTGILGSENYIRVLFGSFGRNNGLVYFFASLALAMVLLFSVIGPKEIEYLHRIFIFTSVGFASYSAIQFFSLDPIQWSNPYNRVIGTLGNPNFSSSALATFAVFWLYLTYRGSAKSIQIRISMLLTGLIMAALSWSTASLQGVVIILLGLGLVFYTAIREKFSSKTIPYLFSLMAILGLSIAFISFAGLGPLGSSLEQYTLKLRGWYASFGLRAMIDSPFYGVGVDNYISAFRSNRTESFVNQYGVALSTNNAHSTPAQIGATFGLIVFVIYCLLHLLISLRALQVINSREETNAHLKGVAIVWILIFSQSLLSIEIIGLGVMNWLLGAILLGSAIKTKVETSNSISSHRNKQVVRQLPAWVGALTIASLAVGAIPTAIISSEDRALKNILTMQVDSPESKEWVRSNFNKLGNFTLLDPDKVIRMVYNLEQSGMGSEIKTVLEDLYRVNSNDVYTNDLLATFYFNTNQPDLELEVRERLRSLDPLNYQLELNLARAYSRRGDRLSLEQSVARIKAIAPDSQESKEAKELLAQSLPKP